MVEFLLIWVGILIGLTVGCLLTRWLMNGKLQAAETEGHKWYRQYELAANERHSISKKAALAARELAEAKIERGDYKMRLERSRAETQRLKSLTREARDLLALADDEPSDEESE